MFEVTLNNLMGNFENYIAPMLLVICVTAIITTAQIGIGQLIPSLRGSQCIWRTGALEIEEDL